MTSTVERVFRHFISTRAVEVLALQASPILGLFLGAYRLQWENTTAAFSLMLGSCALTAHIFIFNDWAGYKSDLRDPLRAPHVFSQRGISRREVGWTAFGLLVLANIAFASVSVTALVFGLAIAALGFVYSSSPILGKSTPIAASLNHFVGGALHFLLGYTLLGDLDAKGICTAVFFGLVFSAGHLNQEVRDYDGDRVNEIRTNAVAFGRRRTFHASFLLFIAAYATLTALAYFGLLPRLLMWSPLAALLHLAWFWQALRRGLSFDTAVWMQQRYRLLFAGIGIVMLIA